MGIPAAAHQPRRGLSSVAASNPATACSRRRKSKRSAGRWTPATIRLPPPRLRFLMLTGWRNGEALSMRWEDVDFETGEIVLASTKTGRAVRTVDGIALQAIADLPRINRVPGVFAGLSYASLWRLWKTVCEAAGIVGARLHDIRRTVATSAAAAGMSAFLLRDLMGHKTLAMANRYVRAGSALQEAQAATASRMAGMMAGKNAEVVPLERRRG